MSATKGKKIRILLLDDHALFREGLARLLGMELDFELLVPCASVDEALRILDTTQVDIVLLDYDLGPETGSRLIVHAAERGLGGKLKVLVVTAGLSDAEAAELLRLGVAGIFLKHSAPNLLSTAIRKVMEGEAWLDQRFLRVLLAGPPTASADDRPPRLSEREREVLRAVLEGQANKEIAGRLRVSESSVKATLQQLFLKTGVRTRSQLVRMALEKFRDYL
jgi:DNA-binding NarL/FixJ family response regulator